MLSLAHVTPRSLINQWYESLRHELATLMADDSSAKWLETFQQDMRRIRDLYEQGVVSARETCRALRALFDALLLKKRERQEQRHTDPVDETYLAALLEKDVRRPSSSDPLLGG